MFGRDQGKVLPRAGGGQDIESGLPESDKSDRVGEVWEGGGEGVGREGGEPSGVYGECEKNVRKVRKSLDGTDRSDR